MFKLLPKNSYKEKPWKNGGGTTAEIALFPQAGGDDFIWRISMAELKESGDFSSFPGIIRTIIQLEGKSIELTHVMDENGETKKARLKKFETYEFDGEWKTYAQVEGACRDLNIMCKKGFVSAKVTIHSLIYNEPFNFKIDKNGELTVLFCLNGEINGDGFLLDQYDSLIIEKKEPRPNFLLLKTNLALAEFCAITFLERLPQG